MPPEINETILGRMVAARLANRLDRDLMASTCTREPSEEKSLTLDEMMRTMDALTRNTILYHTSELILRTNEEGKPLIAAMPESGLNGDFLGRRSTTGRTVALMHPDNLPAFIAKYSGHFNLVECKPR
jgi:hypothetical protein